MAQERLNDEELSEKYKRFFINRAHDEVFRDEFKEALKKQAEERAYFYDKYYGACAPSVLRAIQELLCMGDELTWKASGLLAAGGGSGGTCGALTGGLMGLSLKYGRAKPDLERTHIGATEAHSKLTEWFMELEGTLRCDEILGIPRDRLSRMELIISPAHEDCFKRCGRVAGKVVEMLFEDGQIP